MAKRVFSLVFSLIVAALFYYGGYALSKEDANLYPGRIKTKAKITGVIDSLTDRGTRFYAELTFMSKTGVETIFIHHESYVEKSGIELNKEVEIWYDPKNANSKTIIREGKDTNFQSLVLYILGGMMTLLFLWFVYDFVIKKR